MIDVLDRSNCGFGSILHFLQFFAFYAFSLEDFFWISILKFAVDVDVTWHGATN